MFKELRIDELFVFMDNFNFTYTLKRIVLDNPIEALYFLKK